MSSRAELGHARVYLLVGLALVVAYHWFDYGGYGYEVIGLYGAGGTLAGAMRHAGAARWPWLAFSAGVLLMVGGDVAWDLETRFFGPPGAPNLSDAFYMLAYPALATGLLLLTRKLVGPARGNLLDALVVALSLTTLLWPLLFATFLDSGQSTAQRLTVGVYPCWDLLLLALVARIALSRAMHTRRSLLLIVAVALFLTGDVFWFESINTYVLGDWEDFMWLTAYVCFGAAALYPAAGGAAERPEVTPFRRFALLAIPVALLPGAVVLAPQQGALAVYVDGGLISLVLLCLLIRFAYVVRGLDSAQRELRQQNRLKDELIGVVSHDLRTPLTSIMGYLELALEDGVDREEERTFLEVVQRNTGRLHRLVEDLLFVSRAQAGQAALEVAAVDVEALVRDTVAAVQPEADAAGLELGFDVSAHEQLLLDAHRVGNVLENLLSNALKFTPAGGSVRVTAEHRDSTLVIRVSDTGIGIPEEDRHHLFDRFFRAAGSDGVPGAGLGLSIVKAIVDAHRGRVAVHSRLGAGTTFEVSLPAEPAVPIPDPGEGASALVRMAS